MSIRRIAGILCVLGIGAAVARAATVPQPKEGDVVLKDFRFRSGERLPELKIHYRALGSPRRDRAGTVRNAVLILHGTTGSGKQFLAEKFAGVLFPPGGLLDAATHYLILPDGIGHGGSSKPSDGLHARFPRYGYDDMVLAQYRLLTEGLGVDHVRLVLGTSMGGMHTWVWAEKYPAFADGYVPLACVPAPIAGRNRAWRDAVVNDIRGDPAWNGGDYAAQPPGLRSAVRLLVLMGSNPVKWLESAPTGEAADRFLEEQVRSRLATADANDFVYAFEASRDYDPSPGLASIPKPVLAINSADDLINPPELGLFEKLVDRVPRGRHVLLPLSDRTTGHGTHTDAAVWQEHLRAFLERLTD